MSKEARLLDLTRTLTLRHIPYHPPLKGESLERLKRNNLKGYILLMEYLELEAEERAEKGKVVESFEFDDQGILRFSRKRVH